MDSLTSAYLAVQPFQNVTATTTGKVQQPPSITGKPAAHAMHESAVAWSDSTMLLLHAVLRRPSPMRGTDSCCWRCGDSSTCFRRLLQLTAQ